MIDQEKMEFELRNNNYLLKCFAAYIGNYVEKDEDIKPLLKWYKDFDAFYFGYICGKKNR